MAKSQKKLAESINPGDVTTAKQKAIVEHKRQIEIKNDSGNKVKENTLILLKGRAKKYEDDTISSPDRYVSRFHYTTKNLDTYLEFCPHCKKPTLSAFRAAVIDSAVDYLEGKRVLIDQKNDPLNILKYITYLLAIGTITYFFLSPII